MNVASIMSRHVITAPPTAQVRELWRLLFVKHINAIPVVDKKGVLLGIITQEDLMHALYPDYQEYFVDATGVADFEVMENKVRDMGSKKATDIMNTRVIFTREHTPMMRALSRMMVRSLNQLPVLSDDNVVIGMVTKGDIFKALFKKSTGKTSPSKKKKRG
jgi:CBS-domain-containing membrane protein